MKKFILALMMASAVAMTGCTSHIDAASRPDGPWDKPVTNTGSRDFRADQTRKARFFADATVREVAAVFDDEYQDRFAGANLTASTRVVGNEVEVEFNWTSARALFPPGRYDARKNEAHEGRDAVAFADLVISAVNRLADRLRTEKMSARLQAIYYGQADSLPIRSGSLKYRGEFGDISIPASQITVNGTPRNVTIFNQQVLTNEELATLRAYSLKSIIHNGKRSDVTVQDKYEITVSPTPGAEQRAAWIKVQIVPNGPSS